MKLYLNMTVSALLTLLLLSACGETGSAEAPKPPDGNRVPVRIEVLQPREFASTLQLTGTVKARNHVEIMVEEGGTLMEVRIPKGRYAHAGDTIAVLENRLLEAAYNQARARLNQAELEYRSRTVLFEKKAISENEFLSAKYTYEAAKSALELSAARYDKLFITAPMRGLVNARYYDLGAYATPMTPIFEFIDNDFMYIRAGVPERYMSDILAGTPARIVFDALPDLVLDSEITFVSRSINPQNRTFEIEIRVPNPDRRLAPRMVANLQIERQRYADGIAIPLDALVESEQGWHVFVEEGLQAQQLPVHMVAIERDQVLVNGLAAGQHLIVSGQHILSAGDSLDVR